MDNPLNLIKLILHRFVELQLAPPFKTRLIKILYLLEVNYYRHKREKLTDLEWRFFHYGPYSFGLEKILGSPDLERVDIELDEGKSGVKFLLDEDLDKLESQVDVIVPSLIHSLVKRWGDAELNELLDYVYFETEPMQHAKKNAKLRFEIVPPFAPLKTVRVDKEKLNSIRERMNLLLSQKKPLIRPTIKVDSDLAILRDAWDTDEIELKLGGSCNLDLAHLKDD